MVEEDVVSVASATAEVVVADVPGDDSAQESRGDVAAVLNGSSLPAVEEAEADEEKSLFPRAHELPVRPPRAIECNYTHWAALGNLPSLGTILYNSLKPHLALEPFNNSRF